MALGLRLFTALPLGLGSVVDPYVVATGNGVTTTFPLGTGNGALVGNNVLVNSTLITRSAGGFSISVDNIIFASPPANGAIIVVPGIGYVPLSCTDQTGTNVATTMVYLGDPDQISQYAYLATSPNSSILLSPYNLVPGSGAQPSWFQMSLADGNNNPIGYTSGGASLSVPAITAQDALQANNSGANITVAHGSNFASGYLLNMNPGGANNEVVTVVSVASNVLTTTGFNFSHLSGEPVYHAGYPVLIKTTVPNNAAGGEATSWVNCGIRRTFTATFRF